MMTTSALNDILTNIEPAPLKKLAVQPLRRALFGFAVVGIIVGIFSTALQIDRELTAVAKTRIALIADAATAKLTLKFAMLDRDAALIEFFMHPVLGDPGADIAARREAIVRVEAIIASSALIEGAAIYDDAGNLVAAFGASGQGAGDSTPPASRLLKNGKLDVEKDSKLRFVRTSVQRAKSIFIFQKPTDGLEKYSLILAISHSELINALRFFPHSAAFAFLIDPDGTIIDDKLVRNETWYQQNDAFGDGQQWNSSAVQVTQSVKRQPILTLRAAFADRDLAILVAERQNTFLQSLYLSVKYGVGFLAPAIIAILILCGFIQNEWRLNDDVLGRFARFARGADTALQMANCGVIVWRPRHHELRFTKTWSDQLGLTQFDRNGGIDALTRRLHPHDRERALLAYESVISGTQREIRHRIRLRAADASYVTMEEVVGRTLTGSDELLVIIHSKVGDET